LYKHLEFNFLGRKNEITYQFFRCYDTYDLFLIKCCLPLNVLVNSTEAFLSLCRMNSQNLEEEKKEPPLQAHKTQILSLNSEVGGFYCDESFTKDNKQVELCSNRDSLYTHST
jgi:hypothetical protein